jgi:hypothetical protein
MEYAFIGFLVPAKSEMDANNIISQIEYVIADSECDLSGSYCIAGIPVLDNVAAFGKDLEQLLAKYNLITHNHIETEN